MPLGHGNARNLDAVQTAVLAGKPVWVAATLGDNDPDGLAAALSGASLRRFGDEHEVLQGLAQWQEGDDGSGSARDRDSPDL